MWLRFRSLPGSIVLPLVVVSASHCQTYCTSPIYVSTKMVVFGDSTADSGRRFTAPASFDFEDIGPFPFKKLFNAPDEEVRII